MAKHKLQRFAENETFGNLFQHSDYDRVGKEFPLRGRWREDYFRNSNPIVLELGCGKGEYTIAMSKRDAGKNYIGVDRKGARLWRGCKDAIEQNLQNVAFLRIAIDNIAHYFSEGEVDEIWVTFPDPQPKKERKRLVSPKFVETYRKIIKKDGGILHLKTDSDLLYEYLLETARAEGWPVEEDVRDVYAEDCNPLLTEVQTFYERRWIAAGKTIHYVRVRV